MTGKKCEFQGFEKCLAVAKWIGFGLCIYKLTFKVFWKGAICLSFTLTKFAASHTCAWYKFFNLFLFKYKLK